MQLFLAISVFHSSFVIFCFVFALLVKRPEFEDEEAPFLREGIRTFVRLDEIWDLSRVYHLCRRH